MISMMITPKFGDIDGLGHVNNTVMPQWFEHARNEVYRAFNPDMKFENWNLILAHFEFDFIKQIHYGKEVEVRSWISRIGNSSFEMYQEAWQEDALSTKGKTVLVHFDFVAQKSVQIPDEIRTLLEKHLRK
jgi:acyl-CoA thioester hydrolase